MATKQTFISYLGVVHMMIKIVYLTCSQLGTSGLGLTPNVGVNPSHLYTPSLLDHG